MPIHHINRECNSIERLKETLDIAHREDYTVVGIETKVLEDVMNLYEDRLATDIERIKRAKAVLNDSNALKRDKEEAIGLLNIYRELGKYHIGSEDADERERAEEILHELSNV